MHAYRLFVATLTQQDIDVIAPTLRIVLGNEDRYLSPPGRIGQKFDNASQRVIVISDKRSLVRIAVLGTRLGHVIVRQMNEENLGQWRFAIAVPLRDFSDELRGAELVRHIHIESRILLRGVPVQRIGHRHVCQEAHSGRLEAFAFIHAGQLEALAEIAK